MESRSDSDEEDDFNDAEIDEIVTKSDEYKALGDQLIMVFNISFNIRNVKLALKYYQCALELLNMIDLSSHYLDCCIALSKSTLSFFTRANTRVGSGFYVDAIQKYRAHQQEKKEGLDDEITSRMLYLNLREQLEPDQDSDAEDSAEEKKDVRQRF